MQPCSSDHLSPEPASRGQRAASGTPQDLEEFLKNSKDSSALLTILQKTVLHSLSLKYPPSVKYRRCFLSELIKKHESTAAEPLNQLYEALGDVLNTEETTHCYKSYLLPSGDAVTLCESTAIISRGTTGLVTWDAGLYLAEWALENPVIFRNRSVLELGSGMGLTGITICKACHPRAYIFSDHHQCVLQQLSENIHLNGFFVESEFFQQAPTSAETRKAKHTGPRGPGIVVAELDWHLVTKEQLAKLWAEVVIAADVVYDPELTRSLISVLQKLSSDNSGRQAPDVYIAITIRNPETYCCFQKELEKVGIRWQLVPSPQKNLFPYDRRATINILRLLL
ncbi:protein-lysine N-methyltransferase EEF2KMT isoform X2 [Varanus komodoensis]|uniref:protein-lysine N-methyltransferase EEF2KMT isoform X2 n=1 Tax=Varanus komodoensis TaxID=61221 RepID=UPI001CF7ECB2|nr:protein-lysine N-methyltransferase EEF2KMT isoform X2 [Varanus komodoensis]